MDGVTDWTVRRWARYGHDRLYAETPGGTALGYFDQKSGRYHSDDPSNLPLLRQAIADHLSSTGDDTNPSAPASVTPRVMADGIGSGWTDLSGRRPGAAARARAVAERDAAPVRTAISRLFGVKTDERAWRIGADGEEAVAAQLTRLGSSWRSLHAVEVGDRGSDIDHVVIGPGGVYTVNAKNHPNAKVWVGGDAVMVNGQRVPYVRNSRHESRRAARLLTEHAGFPVSVTGVIAVMGAHRGFVVSDQPRDGSVVVVQRKRISKYLLSRPASLSECEIASIYEVACRSTTWQPAGRPTSSAP